MLIGLDVKREPTSEAWKSSLFSKPFTPAALSEGLARLFYM